MFRDELDTFLVAQLAFKNSEFRKNLPVNYITHEINTLRSGRTFKKNLKYKYDHFNGSLIISHRMFYCDQIHQVLKDVCKYDSFNRENDPYSEKRFGDITYEELSFNDVVKKDHLIFWKIEFYDDNSIRHKTENYLNTNCYRVLTIYSSDDT